MTESPTDFISTVRDYCTWVESAPASQIDEATKAVKLLSALYHHVIELCPRDSGEDIDEERISDDEWKKVYRRFGALPFNYYSDIFSPAKMNEEKPHTGDLADDLAKARLNIADKRALAAAVRKGRTALKPLKNPWG